MKSIFHNMNEPQFADTCRILQQVLANIESMEDFANRRGVSRK
jgi:hypothetical protein